MATPDIARLKTLRAFLATRPEAETNLARWHCGTQFCTLGWATQLPEFQQAGLSLVEETDGYEHYYPPHFGHSDLGFSAGATFFGLTRDQADYLFAPVRIKAEPGFEIGVMQPSDPMGLSDKAVALHRLDTLISELEATHGQA
ncbi:hypothetical protein [Cupriavidus sp. DL-D2]|uniref:hypothetical protein n=1 Tax=Cupriavidus sp. DL-D2 TaxID=3144974 RepID=UPI0032151630